ncbi:sensor histidine kinase [Streptosporangium lutulentum]|uniref:Signal transduction histidine kinase n=1 Tax=Streptosporangium lutulentum TaxID=1461250 RepID=A0ABT9Q820_9ACTN|nr:sensor histidine kinase [Streptosporangium lutulentum]MDP9842094.1 signal transduction histidine kinase [Streptosporangium lutulentum]
MVTTDLGASRWDRAGPALPYLFVLLPTVFVLLRDWRPEVLALALLAGAWHWFMVTSHPAWTERPTAMIVYFVVMLAVTGALVAVDPLFTVTGVAAFIQAFTLLPGWWAYAGVAATAGVLVTVPSRPGRTPDEMLYSFLVAVLIASTAGLLTRTISDQNDQRRVMIVQLRKTGARLAALAEENAALQARLLTSAREAGVLGERQRMAREIHDTVAQSLTAILTQLEAADDAIDDAPAARSRLNTVRALARESLNETRRSVQALRPAPLDEAQLSAALHDIAEKWSQTTGVPAGVSVTGDPLPLHTEVEITLLRVAQEALANVGRHASATRVGLTLSYMEDVVILDVRDDGSGFTPGVTNSPDEGGFGLIAMRQRVTRLAGEFVIETAPGQGTGISATVPAIPADSAPDSSDRRRNAS